MRIGSSGGAGVMAAGTIRRMLGFVGLLGRHIHQSEGQHHGTLSSLIRILLV